MAGTNVVSQLKIKTGADTYETYDLKDNHMIFRDIYYRGRIDTTTPEDICRFNIHISNTSNIYKQIGNNTNDITKTFKRFPNNDTWNNYKINNMWLGYKFIYCDRATHVLKEFGRDYVIFHGSKAPLNGSLPLLETIMLWLEQGPINHYIDGLYPFTSHSDASTWDDVEDLPSITNN